MTSSMSRAGAGVAVGAALVAVVTGIFVPYGYPWPTIVCAVLACALAVWVRIGSLRQTLRVSDVIDDIEAESPAAAAPRRGVVSGGAVS